MASELEQKVKELQEQAAKDDRALQDKRVEITRRKAEISHKKQEMEHEVARKKQQMERDLERVKETYEQPLKKSEAEVAHLEGEVKALETSQKNSHEAITKLSEQMRVAAGGR